MGSGMQRATGIVGSWGGGGEAEVEEEEEEEEKVVFPAWDSFYQGISGPTWRTQNTRRYS